MAAVQGSQPKTVSKGCFKCGKTGHWSRDCSAQPSEWIARPPSQPGQGDTTAQTQAANTEQPAQLQIPLATGKRKRQKPKLTVDHLKAERHGIAEVFHTFPQLFREQFRGKGHEAGDLKRLLELYIGWQQRILPFSTFDAFLEALEKLGSSYVLKMELRELRSGVLRVMEEPTQEDGGWLGMGANASLSPRKEAQPAAAAADKAGEYEMEVPDWDDEDLLAMQAEPMVPSVPSGHAKRDSDHEVDKLELDDDVLLELVGDLPEQDSAANPHSSVNHVNSAAPQEMDNIDDDELQELADANMDIHDSQQQPVQAHQQHENQSKPAAHQEDPTAGQQQAQQGISSHSKTSDDNIHLPEEDVMLDDDELIELACASLSEDISKAPEQDCKADEHSCIGDVPLADTLDDEELLALATTQLDEA